MNAIELKQVRKSFGAAEVIHGIDLEVEEGKFYVFVGPSGCGKSTLLRMIAGLEDISEGELLIDGKRCNDVEPARRGLSMVFQTYALYPHMTVEQNMSFGLRMTGTGKAEAAERVAEAARVLQLEPLIRRKPAQLSGGQRQRVAIGRAIVRHPRAFLFDEPLSNLDAELRVQMRVEIAQLHQRLGSTMIYVTHDQVEAMTMADKIVVLRDGRVEQHGAPLDLYNSPANRFVAGFIGSPKMNFLPLDAVVLRESGLELSLGGQTIEWAAPNAPSDLADAVELGVRPEHLSAEQRPDYAPFVKMHVNLVENLGGQTLIYASIGGGQPITMLMEGQARPQRGEVIQTYVGRNLCHFFNADQKAIR
ncbi:ABC transporter ATP-binding protein [Pelagibacterium xiamenense]|uniref:ABC transporter ATP-binding protein n=1 Tax=Pelagibacterium xiamenense TaxID=2901140 RepID=UPI001E4448CF|nr:sn-glycerol-3-phosphate ABC transporter ATP-binding protein UgpC [Pelagibacterium xiamenense]MCD7059565.1 sn-glycerol-3-phosphate ABC transporter ATP-binding protein UgpC [Pelagibacterium xiamenense]